MNDYDDCHSYLNHLRSEHHRLEFLARQVLYCLRQSSDSSWPDHDRAAVAAKLAALKQELLKHIEEEGRGGCVEEAVSRTPSLSDEARRVYQESEELQEDLLCVMQRVEFDSLAEASLSFQEFANSLKFHDEHEERVVEQGMNFPFDT